MAAKNKHTKKSHNFSLIFAALLSIVLVAIIVFGIFVLVNDPDMKPEDNKKDETTTDVKKDLKNNTDDNAEPKKTEPEDKETTYGDDKAGYESENQEKPVEKTDDGKKIATASLNIAQDDNAMILSGRVTNFKEEGGNCTYILQKDSETPKTYAAPVIPDAKFTVCEAVKLDKKEFTSGEWKVWMEYRSNSAEGASEAQKINI